MFVFFFFFKQKTAYEMRISDWSSDVCSSDLLYLSRDAGNHFEPLVRSTQVLAQWFDLDGEHFWVSSYANSPVLSRMSLSDSGANEKIKLPAFDEDAVAFIAQNPTRHEEFAIATFKRSAYITQDRGDRKSVV